jgi:peptide/nickel transport system permease protein
MMLAFIARRLMQSVFVMLLVAWIAFVLFNFLGDPISNMLSSDASPAERAQMREALGLNDAFHVQFIRFVGNVLRGDLGLSYRLGHPVGHLLLERLPATLELVACAGVLALALGLPLGVYTGLHRTSWLSQLLLTGSLIGVSLPTFLIGILLIFVFSVMLGWLPAFGRGDTVSLRWWTTGFLTVSGLRALILPSLTLTLWQLALILRLVRAEMLEVLRTDYIKFARARGLSQRAIHFGHALKNTLVPVITITGVQLGSLIAFAIITETVFQWPGMGLLFIEAVRFADVPVLAAYLVFVSVCFVLINLVVDLLYFIVDPRLRADRGAAA